MSRYVILIDTLTGGGAEKVMLRLASGLIATGHDARLVILNPAISHDVPSHIKVDVVYTEKGKGLKRLSYYRRAARNLQQYLQQLNRSWPIDVILSNLPATDRVTQYLDFPKIYFCIHNSLYHGYIQERTGLSRHLKQWQMQRLYRNKQLIFVSEGARDDMLHNLGAHPASSRVIYNPFPLNEIRRLAEASTPPFEDYFIHVGRFNRQKRHDRLLRIFKASGTKEKLLLLGEGTPAQLSHLKAQIHQLELDDQVHILDFQQNPFPYIRKAKGLLLTSDYEGLPTVIIESLICGTPVISLDCPSGPREILCGPLRDYLIPIGGNTAFAEKIRELAQQPRRIPAVDAVLERFDEQHILQQYLALATEN